MSCSRLFRRLSWGDVYGEKLKDVPAPLLAEQNLFCREP